MTIKTMLGLVLLAFLIATNMVPPKPLRAPMNVIVVAGIKPI